MTYPINKQEIKKLLSSITDTEQFYNYHKLRDIIAYNISSFDDPNIKKYTEDSTRITYLYKDNPIIFPTAYQAFYPEMFYKTFELCNNHSSVILSKRYVCQLDTQNKTQNHGFLEALINYNEIYPHYEGKKYIRIVSPDYLPKKCDSTFYNLFISNEYSIDNFPEDEFDLVVCHDPFNSILLEKKCFSCDLILTIDDVFDQKIVLLLQKLSDTYSDINIYRASCQHPLDTSICIICTHFLRKTTTTYYMKQLLMIKRTIFDKYIDFLEYMEKNPDDLPKIDYKKNAMIWIKDNNLISNNISPPCNNYSNDPAKFKFENIKYDITKLISGSSCGNSMYVEELHSEKRELNKLRRIIDTQYQDVQNELDKNIINWSDLTNCIDLYRNLRKHLVWKLDIKDATNSWTKFYEILNLFKLIPTKTDTLKTFHVSESTGAFINSLIYYAQMKTTISYMDWYAQTLNPFVNKNNKSTNHIPKDTLKLIKSNPKKWLFGCTNTGDITTEQVINSYVHDSRISNVDLITADGGQKLSPYLYNEQEAVLSKLIYSELLTILLLLPEGKNCVLKAFIPFAENITVSMLFLIVMLFKEVTIIKPVTSHPSSSEIYIICKGYYGNKFISDDLYDKLLWILNNFDHNLCIFDEIPESFIEQVIKCSRLFSELQKDSIKRSLYYRNYYYYNYDVQEEVSLIREKCCRDWINKYHTQKY